MKTFLQRMTFNVPDAGGGGAPAGGSGDPSSAAASPPAGGGTPPAPSAGDPAAGAGIPPAAGDFYRPDGLPEHFLGKDANETMDKLFGAVKGYRERDAANGVPDKPEAYAEFSGDIPAEIKPHLDTLKGDPLFSRLNATAHELRIPTPTYQKLVQQFLSVSAEMGMMEPVLDEAAEKAALVPDQAKHLSEAEQRAAREQRMNDNFAFLDLQVDAGLDPTSKQFDPARGGLRKEDAEFAKANLGDSARGHRFFEWMREKLGGGAGGGPAMGQTQHGGHDAAAELRRRSALPENTVGHRQFDRASYDTLQADYQRHYGK